MRKDRVAIYVIRRDPAVEELRVRNGLVRRSHALGAGDERLDPGHSRTQRRLRRLNLREVGVGLGTVADVEHGLPIVGREQTYLHARTAIFELVGAKEVDCDAPLDVWRNAIDAKPNTER